MVGVGGLGGCVVSGIEGYWVLLLPPLPLRRRRLLMYCGRVGTSSSAGLGGLPRAGHGVEALRGAEALHVVGATADVEPRTRVAAHPTKLFRSSSQNKQYSMVMTANITIQITKTVEIRRPPRSLRRGVPPGCGVFVSVQ